MLLLMISRILLLMASLPTRAYASRIEFYGYPSFTRSNERYPVMHVGETIFPVMCWNRRHRTDTASWKLGLKRHGVKSKIMNANFVAVNEYFSIDHIARRWADLLGFDELDLNEPIQAYLDNESVLLSKRKLAQRLFEAYHWKHFDQSVIWNFKRCYDVQRRLEALYTVSSSKLLRSAKNGQSACFVAEFVVPDQRYKNIWLWHLTVKRRWSWWLIPGHRTYRDAKTPSFKIVKQGGEKNDVKNLLNVFSPVYPLSENLMHLSHMVISMNKKVSLDNEFTFKYAEMAEKGDGVEKNVEEAISEYQQLVDKEDVEAMFRLGEIYRFGQEDEPNLKEASKYYLKAASKGHIKAKFRVGQLFAMKDGPLGYDETKAALMYLDAADNGLPAANVALGLCLYHGRGVDVDYLEAYSRFRKAAEAHMPIAYYNLGVMHENGDGVSQNSYEAFQYFWTAADAGLLEAKFRMGEMHEFGITTEPSRKAAIQWYKEAADDGLVEAQYKLGFLTETTDPRTSIKYYTMASNSRDVKSMNNLGLKYLTGYHVNTNVESGIKYIKRAADAGFMLAQYNYAALHEIGLSVPTNYAIAFEYYKKAASQGDAQSLTRIGSMFRLGQLKSDQSATQEDLAVEYFIKAIDTNPPDPRAFSCIAELLYYRRIRSEKMTALEMYQKAAELGDYYGLINTGLLLAHGDSTNSADYSLAFTYFKRALSVKKEAPEAHLLLAKSYEQGHGTKQDLDMAERHYVISSNLGNKEAFSLLDQLYGDASDVDFTVLGIEKAATVL